MEQRSQMLRQMRLTKTEREREVSGLVQGVGRWLGRAFGDAIRRRRRNVGAQVPAARSLFPATEPTSSLLFFRPSWSRTGTQP